MARPKPKARFGREADGKKPIEPGRAAPTIMAGGIAGVALGQYSITQRSASKRKEDKPPYTVPTMAEVNATKPNGLTVVSTFSGCGGSCLGFRMAGFRTLWANDFTTAARESFEANKAPGTILDGRDIRAVTAEDILKATGLKKGELDVFDGSPPCQAFSTAGRRERTWGLVRKDTAEKSQRLDDLFFEYARLLRGLQPKVFIAENVSGLVKGVAKGYFLEILQSLEACGYVVECRVLDAKWLGVPQSRQRVIFQGVRKDLKRKPAWPKPLSYQYSIIDAIPWIAHVDYDSGGIFKDKPDVGKPMKTITVRCAHHFTVTGRVGQRPNFRRTAIPANGPMNTICADDQQTRYRVEGESPRKRVRVVAGSFQNFHKKKDVTAKPCPALLTAQPNHYLIEGDGSDAQSRNDHGAERRKFTIPEVKRLCSFPDDFILTGSYAQQWERLGLSVPPLMMKAVADQIRDVVLK